MKKRLVWILVLAIFATSLTACGGGGPSTKPEDDLAAFFDAFKAQDFVTVDKYTQGGLTGDLEFNSEDPTEQMGMDIITNIDYKINDVKEDGENRVVNVDLTHMDLEKVTEQIMGTVMTKAFEVAFSEGSEDMSDEELETMMMDIFKEEMDKLQDDPALQVTDNINMVMVPAEEEDHWKVDTEQSKEFVDVMFPDDLDEIEEAAPDGEGGNETSDETTEETTP